MNTEHDADTAPVQVDIQVGPGVAPDAMTYVADRLRGLGRFAPHAIDMIRARVAKPRDTMTPGLLHVRATVALGDRVLRAQGASTSLRAAVDVVCDRLRRRLADLPHGQRGDYVPHHRPRELTNIGGRHGPGHA
ncbi:MAG TPA: HPF/RaiA family ribosome-associated protein [Pseudonocardiaceae bacterium]|jgi:ribosome-associated translation inhibitor RaiA